MSGWLAPSSSLAGPRSPPCWPPAGAASLPPPASVCQFSAAQVSPLLKTTMASRLTWSLGENTVTQCMCMTQGMFRNASTVGMF